MKNIEHTKQLVRNIILKKLSVLPGIHSITFVGSFPYAKELSAFSDIDIVVIVDQLTPNVLQNIRQAAETISGEDCGMQGIKVKLNMNFGPLKVNEADSIVFHLMVYDIAGHKKHVIESPFTCYDWQFEKALYGEDLAKIYPSDGLQLADLVNGRRSLESYLTDLKKGAISYAVYIIQDDKVKEEKQFYLMDDRHKKEYAYHVMKFLLLNLLKIIYQKNIKCSDEEVISLFKKIDNSFENDMAFFLSLSKWKRMAEKEPEKIIEQLTSFISHLKNLLEKLDRELPSVFFFRHAKTNLNNGSFLGITRDPEILQVPPQEIPGDEFDIIYSGSLKRAVQTADLLQGSQRMQTVLLNEINYGAAEGFTIDALKKQFPALVEAWARQEDPKFPGGESQWEVAERLNSFIQKFLLHTSMRNIAVVTHNVVIRILLARVYQTPVHDWYRFQPGHLEPIAFRIFKDILIPDLTKEQRIKFREQIVQ